MTLLSARGLSHKFPDGGYGIRDLDIDIFGDELLLIAGRNGSGKTVLMLHLVGLLEPTEGTVHYRGIPVSKRTDEVRNRIGIVLQDPRAQFLGQTVAEDVGFGLEFEGVEISEVERRVYESLKIMNIADLANRRPFFLSGGEQRKSALAALLVREPEALILDEPFIGLDLTGVVSITESIIDLRRRGHAVVVITHDIEKILAHADRLAIMDDGRVVASGQPGDMISRLKQHAIRTPRGSIESMSWLE